VELSSHKSQATLVRWRRERRQTQRERQAEVAAADWLTDQQQQQQATAAAAAAATTTTTTTTAAADDDQTQRKCPNDKLIKLNLMKRKKRTLKNEWKEEEKIATVAKFTAVAQFDWSIEEEGRETDDLGGVNKFDLGFGVSLLVRWGSLLRVVRWQNCEKKLFGCTFSRVAMILGNANKLLCICEASCQPCSCCWTNAVAAVAAAAPKTNVNIWRQLDRHSFIQPSVTISFLTHYSEKPMNESNQ
jgi:hypothetical protein